ncbi:hypothetical protein [Sphingorhabdus sp.]|jgi:hypothetical protein|uniref:hypothetical protein n=1 Tax=Sphingorhabdus sp. TaxID=1902408 RepID=UPI003BB1FE81|nr:hypothetical protein [Sphingomonadales bacterium]MBL0021250.1 hypothetical protein [Sphingomonadales bacterium]
MKLNLFALIMMATTAPLAAHSVEAGSGDWTNIPWLAEPAHVRLSEKAMESIDNLVKAGKCDAIGDRRRIELNMDFLAEFSPKSAVKRLIVGKIGCPEVEQIVATAASQAAEKGWLKPTGENEANWYRGRVTYSFK